MAVVSNLQPASIEVSSNLAQDTVIAGVMDIAVGPNKVAMFANPMSGGSEEMLYCDEQNTLRWARQLNPGSPDGPESSGWSIEPIQYKVAQVVVGVHPNGQVCAFALHVDGRHIDVFELVPADDARGGQAWLLTQSFQPGTLPVQGLQMQYAKDRPASPFVFVVEPTEPRVFWIGPAYPAEGDQRWSSGGDFALNPADRGADLAIGVDSPVEVFTIGAAVRTIRVWSLKDGDLFLTTYSPWTNESTRVEVASGWTALAGIWTHPYTAGVVVTDGGRGVSLFLSVMGVICQYTMVLDRALSDLVVWQDAANLLHLYGRDSDGALNAVHQLGWVADQDSLPGVVKPVWDEHTNASSTVATTRPLVGQVATFAVDAYPDDMPSQHVMHQGVPPGETCSIYTQDLRSTFWSREQIRMVPEKLPAPYLVPRYETTLTVKNGYGTPMSGVAVSLTSDAPVDLEVAGRFYRTGTINPATLYTDFAGRLTLRVVAAGLSVPSLTGTVPGLAQAVSVQMASDVHKFLAGNGTLPNHRDGFTDATVTNAKKPDGTPLFDKINRGDAADDWPPSAQDVVTWCKAAFSIEAGQPLPAEIRGGLGEGERVHGFTLQTHDPSRPGFQVFTSPDQLAARREAILAKGGFFDDFGDWVGDVWLGIRQGVTEISEVFANTVDRIIEMTIELADGILATIKVAWDSIVSAAHAVEAVFVAIGAAVHDALQWLQWLFDFKDVWRTKTALEQAFLQLPAQVKEGTAWLREASETWVAGAEAAIHGSFDAFRQTFTDQGMGRFDSPGIQSDKDMPTNALGAQKHLQSAHAGWFQDKLAGSDADYAVPARVGVSPFDQMMVDIAELPAWELLQPIWSDAMEGLGDLFDPNNPNSASQTIIVTMLNVFEDVLIAGIEFAEGALKILLDFLDAVMDTVVAWFNTPLDGPGLLQTLWEFIQDAAGVPPEQYETLTVGRVGILIGAYPTTLVYKVVFGEAPFLDAETGLEQLRNLPGVPALGEGVGGVITPNKWSLVKSYQGYCVILMAFDAGFDVFINDLSYLKAMELPFVSMPGGFWMFCAANHFLAYGIGDYPPVWGNDFPPAKGGNAAEWGPTATWLMSVISNGLDLACAFEQKTFVAQFEEDKLGVGANIYSLLGLVRLILSGVRYDEADDKDYPFAKWNVAINVTSFFSAATGIARRLMKEQPNQTSAGILLVKSVLDAVCDLFAGFASLGQVAWEDNYPPKIVDGLTPGDAKVGVEYGCRLGADNGFQPYSWTVTPVEKPSPGAKAGLPPGVTLTDGNVGYLKGTPELGSEGTYEFWLTVSDDYGPTFQYRSDEPVQIVVAQ